MRATSVALTVLLCATPAAAQEAFDGTLVVQQGGHETGREKFSLRAGRVRGVAGSTLTVEARYPSARVQADATLQRTEEGALALFKLRVESPDGPVSILAAGSGARLIVRTEAKGTETGGDMPAGPDVVLLDDNVYALYTAVADAATAAGARLRAVFPRSGKRVAFVARRETSGGATRVQLTGEITGTLTLDASGRLQRLDFPGSGVVITRQES
jgi:hypothetical protein